MAAEYYQGVETADGQGIAILSIDHALTLHLLLTLE
jgi:hypothetical protein